MSESLRCYLLVVAGVVQVIYHSLFIIERVIEFRVEYLVIIR
jgi:hypothetical protein